LGIHFESLAIQSISNILRIYPRLQKVIMDNNFSNTQLLQLARVENAFLREKLVSLTKERDWSFRSCLLFTLEIISLSRLDIMNMFISLIPFNRFHFSTPKKI